MEKVEKKDLKEEEEEGKEKGQLRGVLWMCLQRPSRQLPSVFIHLCV